MKKWGMAILAVVFIVGLYIIEFSKIKTTPSDTLLNLDNIKTNEASLNWDAFYRVRATIIDGQSAEFKIPRKLRNSIGEEMELTGAALFYSTGCYAVDDKIAVKSMFLVPTLGLANACVHLPEIAMRWTIIVNLEDDWIITRNDMIQTVVKVKGAFRINTEKPYDAAFFLDHAVAELIEIKEEHY